MNKYLKLLISIVICEVVGLLSTPFTIASIPTWYQTLHKPFFSPPNWVFGPVWTVLYCLMGVSLFLIWEKGFTTKKAKVALKYFVLQLALNFFWSVIFFGFHAPLLALIDIVLLLGGIILTMRAFRPLSKIAFYVLVPYLLWVSFASLLNLAIVVLN